MKYLSKEHEQFFKKFCSMMKNLDVYHLPVAYLLALDRCCREHHNDIFNFEEDAIICEGLHHGWQTGTSRKTTRLIFNLWNGCCCDGDTCNDENGYETDKPSPYYAVDEIFSCCLAPFYWEAIKLRYPEYTSEELK